MKYTKTENKITIYNLEDFDIKQILDCGQIFRYKIEGNTAIVHSKDMEAIVKTYQDKVEILTNNVDYLEHFFDLKTDYSTIKQKLKNDKFLTDAVEFGKGIRILKNDAFEMIVSFIISANNRIARIKYSIERLCEMFGKNMGSYFAFPTLNQLKKATIQDFLNAGLGFRAKHLYSTIQTLTEEQISNLKTLSKQEKFNFLVSLKGVGEKVANCVLLFGLNEKQVFPVDTWINKVYNYLTGSKETDRKKITKILTEKYGDLSGYAQQYFFYYFRENNLK